MKSHIPIVLALDFDDTIVKSKFPEIIRAKKGAVKYINKLHKKGYYIIIWTCRHGEHIDMATKWLADNEILFHNINTQHPRLVEYYGNDTRKISADIYVDDKALAFFFHPGWRMLYWFIRLKSLFIKRKTLDV